MKDEIRVELDDYIQSINSSFSVVDTMGSLSLIYTNSRYVLSDFRFYSKNNFTVYGISGAGARDSLDVIEAFHDKAVELLKKNEKKYTIQNKIKEIFDEIKNVSNFINENKPTGVEMYQELRDLMANVLE